MINTHYQPIYRQATAMQNKFHDYTHMNAYDPAAKALQHQMHGLTNDIASNRNSSIIDNRIRSIQTQLRRTQMTNPGGTNGSPVMSRSQTQFLHSNLEHMRQNVINTPKF